MPYSSACDIERLRGDVLVLFGDTPLLTAETMQNMLSARRAEDVKPAVVVLGFRPDNPAEYGRLVTGADGALEAIVEPRTRPMNNANWAYATLELWQSTARICCRLLDGSVTTTTAANTI